MARMRFTVGMRYLLRGQVFIINEMLLGNRLRVENQSFGGQLEVSMDELIRDLLKAAMTCDQSFQRPPKVEE